MAQFAMLYDAWRRWREAVDTATDGLPLLQRMRVRRQLRGDFVPAMRCAAREFALQEGETFEVWAADPEDDTPILDFWRWLIEQQAIQRFMEFLAKVFIPAIVALFMADE